MLRSKRITPRKPYVKEKQKVGAQEISIETRIRKYTGYICVAVVFGLIGWLGSWIVGLSANRANTAVTAQGAPINAGCSGTNPLAFHKPLRDGNTLVYASTRSNATVVAAFDGTISKVNGRVVNLSGKNKDGLPLVMFYDGITIARVKLNDKVKCGVPIGTLLAGGLDSDSAILRVSVTVSGKPLKPPEGLSPALFWNQR